MKPKIIAASYSGPPPEFMGYQCSVCGRLDVKLWRTREIMVGRLELKCVDCACRVAGIQPCTVNALGSRPDDDAPRGSSESIGGLCPAVPNKVGPNGQVVTYWDYHLAPEEALEWWRQMPNYS